MSNPRTIYFVEGLPGSGKTTLSMWLQNHLQGLLVTESHSNTPMISVELPGSLPVFTPNSFIHFLC